MILIPDYYKGPVTYITVAVTQNGETKAAWAGIAGDYQKMRLAAIREMLEEQFRKASPAKVEDFMLYGCTKFDTVEAFYNFMSPVEPAPKELEDKNR